MPPYFTNAHVYLAIAEDSAAESKRLLEAGRRPKPDGQPGYVVMLDLQQTSFKQSMIAIAFAGMYLEALLGLVGKKRLSEDEHETFSWKTWEAKLKRLGVRNPSILAGCKRFRLARNDLVHEKAVDLDAISKVEMRTAQEEAAFAIGLIRRITGVLDGSANSS